jgi:methylaspartate mutase epsilon subunit
MGIQNKRIDEDVFLSQRPQVLSMWKTGREVDLAEAIAYQKSLPAHKNLPRRLQQAKREGSVLMHNLTGQSTLASQLEFLTRLQNQGGSGLLQCLYDSYTRTCRFEHLEAVIRDCEANHKNLLNGYPLVNYGVAGNRRLVEALDRPVGALGPAVDSRLASEIALASGFTQLVDNTYIVFETYTKTAPLEEIMGYFQYSLRLAGYYQEHGVPISVTVATGAAGDNSPGVAPPSLGTAGRVLGALSAATQGVKYLTAVNWSHGNIAQDVASSLVSQKLAREYLDRFGFHDVELFMENGCLGGPYPYDFDEAFAEVMYAGVVSALSGSQMCQVKTFDESSGIPTLENQVRSLRGTAMMYRILRTPRLDFPNSQDVKDEAAMEEREVRAIVEKVLELGDGDPLVGAIKAYDFGVMDNPVANNPRVKCKVMGVKDANGAVRYLDTGNLPFDKDIVEFHRQKIAARERVLGKQADYDTVVADMRAIASGKWLHS